MGSLAGRQLQPRELARISYDAGWRDLHQLVVTVAVCLAESQGYDHAVNQNPDGTTDRGIFQLNTIHDWITDQMAYDPGQAAKAAFKLWQSDNGWTPWAAFNSGVYLHDTYVGRAALAVMNAAVEFVNGKGSTLPLPLFTTKELRAKLAAT